MPHPPPPIPPRQPTCVIIGATHATEEPHDRAPDHRRARPPTGPLRRPPRPGRRQPPRHAAHILTLKAVARRCGLHVPLYTVTGWGGAWVPEREVLPVLGAYPAAPWRQHAQPLPPPAAYLFQAYANDAHIGADLAVARGGGACDGVARGNGTLVLSGVQPFSSRRRRCSPWSWSRWQRMPGSTWSASPLLWTGSRGTCIRCRPCPSTSQRFDQEGQLIPMVTLASLAILAFLASSAQRPREPR